MKKMKRGAFLKTGALAMLAPLGSSLLLQAAPPFFDKHFFDKDEDLLKRLLDANDGQVTDLLQSINSATPDFSRKIGSDFAVLSASWCSPGSKYYHDPSVVATLEILVGVLVKFQGADGTVNIANLESPPDTAFLIELLTGGAHLLIKDNTTAVATINSRMKAFLLKSGEALAVGGVHTPNHRWVISAALARLHALYPNKKYTDRIEDWLSEGVFQDSDGHYPERSGIYSGVENAAFISIGRLLNKPFLFDYVRKNLEMTSYYAEPNGDLVTNDSRRQDQYLSKGILPFYLHYRYLAIKENNSHFAGMVKWMEQLAGFKKEVLEKHLFHLLEDPLLQQNLPAVTPPPEHYEKLFATSSLLRIRNGKKTTTLFGGVDWPLTIASGRSNSPDFYAFRNGNAVLKSLRLSTGFFSMGYFYSEGIKKAGNKYILHKKLSIPYYQPLPKNFRNTKGDYKLSPSIDDRFWNKMDFANRPVSNVKRLETTITFSENNGNNELQFQVTGLVGVPVTIELCFLEGGTLSGVTEAKGGNSFLEKGKGLYERGGDQIRFGPGTITHKSITALEGERYSTHFGSLRTEGMHVYLTGTTPFNHTLIIG
ncbi:MAG: hypothetical protein V4722_15300 [Bacteroidota bacterium]